MFELFPVHSSPLYILYIAIANYQVKMDERLKDFQVTAHRCFLWKSCSMANCCILLDSIQNIESLKDLIFSLRIQIWYMNCQELSIDTLGDSDCWSSSFRKYLHIWYVFDFIWFLKNETKKIIKMDLCALLSTFFAYSEVAGTRIYYTGKSISYRDFFVFLSVQKIPHYLYYMFYLLKV